MVAWTRRQAWTIYYQVLAEVSGTFEVVALAAVVLVVVVAVVVVVE